MSVKKANEKLQVLNVGVRSRKAISCIKEQRERIQNTKKIVIQEKINFVEKLAKKAVN